MSKKPFVTLEMVKSASKQKRKQTAPVAKIIPFTGITKLDLAPDMILENNKGKLAGVVIMGWDAEGEEVFASSYADGGTVLWLLERCKARLLGAE